jgi:hypothetical protein
MADEAKTFTQEQVEALVAEQVGALREKNEELIGELRSASAKLKSYDGVDVKSMTARLAELEQQSKAEKAGMTSEALAKLRQDVEVDVVKRLQSDQTAALRLFPWAEDLAKENRSLKLDSVVKAEMAKGGARAERVDALFRLTADRWDLTEDGKPVLKDKPATELGKYVADELRKEYPEFYTGSGSTGGGASRSKGAASSTPGFIQADAESYRANVEKLARGEVKMVTP